MEFTNEEQLFQQVITEAWENAEFKAELLVNPVAAIEKLTGRSLTLPEGKTLVVRDQTADNTMFINIPAKEEVEDVELSDEQLEAVSGGVIDGPYGGCIPSNPFDIIKIGVPSPTFPDSEIEF